MQTSAEFTILLETLCFALTLPPTKKYADDDDDNKLYLYTVKISV